MGAGIHLSCEYWLLQDEPKYNQPWVRDCVGEEGLQQLVKQGAYVINGGVFGAGNVEDFLDLLRYLIVGIKQGCNDQGYMIYVGYTMLKDKAVFHHASSDVWVTNAPEGKHGVPVDLTVDAYGRLCNSTGHPYALVHQGDRFRDLWLLRIISAAGGRHRVKNFRFKKE
jgi:hypothetical protein